MTELDMLKDIYFLLFLTASILIAFSALKVLNLIFTMKKGMAKFAGDKKSALYQSMFEQDHLTELVEKCNADLAVRPNSPLALFYLVKVYALRQEFMRMQDYLDRLHLVDPSWKKNTTDFVDLIREREVQ